jgi:tripartite ATP-independent transporter DctM subunit
METAGIWMLLCVGLGVLLTGLPAWVVLIGTALAFAAGGLAFGALSLPILTAVPPRLIGLLEQDLIQALPLYVLMGALLNRLPLARILYGVGTYAMRGTRSAPRLMSLVLGMLLAPINGSVGASVAMLTRTVQKRLHDADVPDERAAAIICSASTFGVVIPPSLVLILLGDAMMRAHTEALNATGMSARIINSQDLFRGALAPALLFFLLCLAATWWGGRRDKGVAADAERPRRADWIVAGATVLFLVGLLAGVALGYFYAVEGAAAGGLALVVFGLATRTLTWRLMREVLRDTMALSGALFALLVAATMFTLVLRIFGTDRWVSDVITGMGGTAGEGASGATSAVAVGMLVLACSALVLDAFEIIFVVIPIVMPPLLMRVSDAVWMSVIALLMLQASFLLPPLGYAVLLIRGEMKVALPTRQLVRALTPYVAAQLAVLALVLGFPQITRIFATERAGEPPPIAAQAPGKASDTSNDEAWQMLQRQRDEQRDQQQSGMQEDQGGK